MYNSNYELNTLPTGFRLRQSQGAFLSGARQEKRQKTSLLPLSPGREHRLALRLRPSRKTSSTQFGFLS